VLRGGHHGDNVNAEVMAKVSDFARPRGLLDRVLVDCSHGNSGRCPAKQLTVSRTALNLRSHVAGIMVESYLEGGSQKDLGIASSPYCSITDPCLSWEETVEFLSITADLYVSGSIQRNHS
jgi:3-deoxy-7-phosphoheptulonate synthase